jgi:hypothetical protein
VCIAVWSHINKATTGWLGMNNMMIANGEKTEVSIADFNTRLCRFFDNAKPHGRKTTPTIFCGEKPPVVESIATECVTHVV